MPRKREMPKSIRIAGRTILILKAKLDTCRGVHAGHDNRITIDADTAGDEQKAVLLHEILHDVDQCCGAGLSEQVNSAMSSVLFGVFRDNPDLVAWLMS